MIRDWDLWPLYLDRGWVDAEAVKRLAEINRAIMRVVKAWNESLPSAQDANDRLAAALKHQPAPTARK